MIGGSRLKDAHPARRTPGPVVIKQDKLERDAPPLLQLHHLMKSLALAALTFSLREHDRELLLNSQSAPNSQ